MNDLRQQRFLWRRRHRGTMTEIAERLGVGKSFVSQVFHGHRNSRVGDVELALIEAGAPGVKPSPWVEKENQ